MKKKGKKIVNDNSTQFAISYGTVDYTNNKSIYIDITSWVEPLIDDNPKGMISLMKKTIRTSVFGQLPNTEFNNNQYIVDLDLRESGIHMGKRSFMSCSITLYTNHELSESTGDITSMVDVVVEALKTNFKELFEFNKRKKD